jgi:DNA-binding transcriptional ArsR family regulator
MTSTLSDQIFELLISGQRSYTDICRQCGGSPSNVSAHLRVMLDCKAVIKSRVGKNVFYALRGQELHPNELSNKETVIKVLERYPYLQFHEILVKSTTVERSDVSKALASLVFEGSVFRHRKENSKNTYYSTSNFVDGLLLVNPKRRNQIEVKHNIGPFLREFLFGLPIPV